MKQLIYQSFLLFPWCSFLPVTETYLRSVFLNVKNYRLFFHLKVLLLFLTFVSKIKKEKLEAKFQKEVEEVDLPHIQDYNLKVLMRNVKL